MEDSAFSDEFCRFLQTSIRSFEAAELLVLLAGLPEGSRVDKEDLLPRLPAGSTMTMGDLVGCLQAFESAGLIRCGSDKCIEYHPANNHLSNLALTLVRAYNQRPVTLIRLIYALRNGNIQSFADAFRFR